MLALPCLHCTCTTLDVADLKGWSSATAKISSPMAAMVSCSWVCLAMFFRKYVMALLRERSSPLDTMIFKSVNALTTYTKPCASRIKEQKTRLTRCVVHSASVAYTLNLQQGRRLYAADVLCKGTWQNDMGFSIWMPCPSHIHILIVHILQS